MKKRIIISNKDIQISMKIKISIIFSPIDNTIEKFTKKKIKIKDFTNKL